MNLKTKIWLTIAAIVLMFSFFTLYYFPERQAHQLLDNNNKEVENLAKTVALGAKIALKQSDFEGLDTALMFVKNDRRFKFVTLLKIDRVDSNNTSVAKENVFATVPENNAFQPNSESNDTIIIKKSLFELKNKLYGIQLGFSTREIIEGKKRIRVASLLVSAVVFLIGIIMGFWLSKTISKPVLALRNAAIKVGEGDLTQRVRGESSDEIGELGKSFNEMVENLEKTTLKLKDANHSLASTNQKLNTTLEDLKTTQAQLVHAEKMASLGELTAGIAHEIQNPLNFVNNFSEVSTEFVHEMKEEIAADNKDEALSLADELITNLEKITHHGKRADGIVKGMLQHSRASSSKKELTDINTLADEYLRLSYHGLRAKDKTFNANFETEFDPGVGKIEVIPQDLGRVILNLFNNAFYSVNEKRQQLGAAFDPKVLVKTKRTGDRTIIYIRDNGLGIPQKIIDKVFQPFFTTKPTGQGTGLGLSLSYDIITKGHGGELKIDTKEGEFAEFTIVLPAK